MLHHFINRFLLYSFRGLPLSCFLGWPHPLHYFVREMMSESYVLDIGCGDGNLLKAINHYRACQGVGLDIKPIQDTESVKFFQIDLTKGDFPFPDDTFDFVVMNHVLEHLPEVDHIISEIVRVMKPNGVCYIETPNQRTTLLPSINFKLEQGMPINFYDDTTHIRPYNEFDLIELFPSNLRHIKWGKSRNWFRVIISPIKIISGFLFGNRRDIFVHLWQLIGGSSYIICKKE